MNENQYRKRNTSLLFSVYTNYMWCIIQNNFLELRRRSIAIFSPRTRDEISKYRWIDVIWITRLRTDLIESLRNIRRYWSVPHNYDFSSYCCRLKMSVSIRDRVDLKELEKKKVKIQFFLTDLKFFSFFSLLNFVE